MSYTITRTNANAWPQITIAPLTVDTTSTSLTLWGRGAINWGQLEQSNFVHLLENFAGPSAPLHPIDGQIWYDTSNLNSKVLRVYNYNTLTGTGNWVTSGAAGSGGAYPVPAAVGELWYDTSTHQLMVCTAVDVNGIGTWVPVSLAYIATTEPVAPLPGQLWYNSSTDNLEYWSGDTSKWQVIIGNSASSVPPLGSKIGQLWFNTNTSILNFWNGTIWEPLNGTIVLPGTTSGIHDPIGLPPGYSKPIGQFWFNTTNSTLEFWDGSNWQVPGVSTGVQPTNPRPGQFWLNAITSTLQYFDANQVWQTVATTYSGATAPSPAHLGQLWYDPVAQLLKVYNGAAWVAVSPTLVAGEGISIDNDTVNGTATITAIPNWAIGLVFA